MKDFKDYGDKIFELIKEEYSLMPELNFKKEDEKPETYDLYMLARRTAYAKVMEYRFWVEGAFGLYKKLKEELEKNEAENGNNS